MMTLKAQNVRAILYVALLSPDRVLGGVPEHAADHGSRRVLGIAGCGKLHRARSRLYRSQILQVNMRLKALNEIYTMHSFALF